jgi:protein disulfide-isomerase
MSHTRLPSLNRTLFFALAAILVFVGRSAFAGDLGWTTDFSQAKSQAASEKKLMLLDFTGSDWCPWCIKMDKEVFDQKAFADFATKLVLVKLDFPQSKEQPPAEKAQNSELAKKYNIEGFPTYVLLDSSGKEVRRQVGYLPGGPSEFIKWAGSKD